MIKIMGSFGRKIEMKVEEIEMKLCSLLVIGIESSQGITVGNPSKILHCHSKLSFLRMVPEGFIVWP